MALFPTRIMMIRNMIIPRPGFIVLSSGFDLQSLASLSAKSDPKPRDHEYKLTSHSDLSAEQSFLNAQSFSISKCRKISPLSLSRGSFASPASLRS